MTEKQSENNPLLQRLSDLNQQADVGGGLERQARQRSAGKLTARERIEFLLDDDSFEELDKFVTHRCPDIGMQEQKYSVARFPRPMRRRSARSWISQ